MQKKSHKFQFAWQIFLIPKYIEYPMEGGIVDGFGLENVRVDAMDDVDEHCPDALVRSPLDHHAVISLIPKLDNFPTGWQNPKRWTYFEWVAKQ